MLVIKPHGSFTFKGDGKEHTTGIIGEKQEAPDWLKEDEFFKILLKEGRIEQYTGLNSFIAEGESGQELERLKAENEALKAENAQLRAEIESLKADGADKQPGFDIDAFNELTVSEATARIEGGEFDNSLEAITLQASKDGSRKAAVKRLEELQEAVSVETTVTEQ